MSKPKHSHLQQAQGFTLLELLIYMGLFTGFLTILSAFFITTLETQTDAIANSNLDADSWYIISRLQHDLYQANAIITPDSNGAVSNSLTLDFGDHQLTYTLLDGKITITQDEQSQPLLSKGINATDLSFTKLSNDENATSITVESNLSDVANNLTRELKFTVGLR